MPHSINFVESRRKRLNQASLKDGKTRLISIITLIISFTIFLIVVAVRLFMQQTLASLENREETIKKQILAAESTEKEYTLFVNKLQTLTKLFDDRKDKQQTIAYFNNVFGNDVIIKEIEYAAEDQQVAFALQAKDIFTLDTVYKVFNSPAFMEQYPSIQKTGLRREGTGVYIMEVNVSLDPQAAKPTNTNTRNSTDTIVDEIEPES